MASNVDNVRVEISVVLGRSVIPMHFRGARHT